MRAVVSLIPVLLVALGSVSLTVAGCDSDPAAPEKTNKGVEAAGGSSSGGSTGSGVINGTTNEQSGGKAQLGSGGADLGGLGGTAAGGTDGSGPATQTRYPDGPYGLAIGDVVKNYRFYTLMNPKAAGYDGTQGVEVQFADFYNPDGDAAKPLVLVVTASARWCTYCKQEAAESMGHWKYWNPKGVQFYTLLFEDAQNPPEPATPQDLKLWTDAYNLEYPVGLDPELTLGEFFNASAAPFNMVVDLKTMKIVFKQEGAVDFGPDNDTLKQATGN